MSSEDPKPEESTIFGMNVLKVARNINLIGGIGLVAVCVLNLLNLFSSIGELFTEPGLFLLNIYLGYVNFI